MGCPQALLTSVLRSKKLMRRIRAEETGVLTGVFPQDSEQIGAGVPWTPGPAQVEQDFPPSTAAFSFRPGSPQVHRSPHSLKERKKLCFPPALSSLCSSPLWGEGVMVKMRGSFPVPGEPAGVLKLSPRMKLDVRRGVWGSNSLGCGNSREQGVGEGRSSQGRLPGGGASGWLYKLQNSTRPSTTICWAGSKNMADLKLGSNVWRKGLQDRMVGIRQRLRSPQEYSWAFLLECLVPQGHPFAQYMLRWQTACRAQKQLRTAPEQPYSKGLGSGQGGYGSEDRASWVGLSRNMMQSMMLGRRVRGSAHAPPGDHCGEFPIPPLLATDTAAHTGNEMPDTQHGCPEKSNSSTGMLTKSSIAPGFLLVFSSQPKSHRATSDGTALALTLSASGRGCWRAPDDFYPERVCTLLQVPQT